MAEDKGKKPSDDAEDEIEEAESEDEASIDESDADDAAGTGDEEDAAGEPESVVPPKSKKSKKSAKKGGQSIKSKAETDAASKPSSKKAAQKPSGGADAERVRWPVDKDHRSSIKLLTGEDADRDIDLSEDPELTRPATMNMVLLLVIIAVAVVGTWQFYTLSSAEALAAKRQAREEVEQKHLEEQLAKQKKYGILRIETSPGQADVYRDGVKMVTKKEDTGEEIVVQTPTNMLNTEVTPTYKFKVEKVGYEPFEFVVSEHLWTKDAGSGEYKFVKMIELTPNICDYWFLYDAKKRREMKFMDGKKEGEPTGKDTCQVYYDEAVGQGTSVTECTCKLPPEGTVPPDPKAPK